jgi:hypothetical protein
LLILQHDRRQILWLRRSFFSGIGRKRVHDAL